MAIGTYAELTSAILSFSSRPDLSAQTDNFIALAEEAIYNGIGTNNPLRVSGMQETVSSGLPTLPSDFLEAIRLTVQDGNLTSNVEYLSPDLFASIDDTGGTSLYYTIIDGELKTVPSIASLSYELVYYKRLPALSVTNTTNAILTNAPSVYLWGALMFLYKMTRDRDAELACMRDFAAAVTAFQKRDRSTRNGGSALMVRAV